MFEGSALGVIHYYSILLFFLFWQPISLKLKIFLRWSSWI